MQTAILSIGTNLGNKVQNLITAIELLNVRAGKLLRKGAVYETESWGFKSDQVFLNQLVSLHTDLSPEELLSTILDIEKEMGRYRINQVEYVSRIIDIDILFYEEDIINQKNLSIPHPHIGDRRFILIPLAALFPHFRHPVNKLTASQMLKKCNDTSDVRLLIPVENQSSQP